MDPMGEWDITIEFPGFFGQIQKSNSWSDRPILLKTMAFSKGKLMIYTLKTTIYHGG